MSRRASFYAGRPKSIYIFEWLVSAFGLMLFIDIMLIFTAIGRYYPATFYVMDGLLKMIVPVSAILTSFIIALIFSEFIAHRASDRAKRLYAIVAGSSVLIGLLLLWQLRLPSFLSEVIAAGFAAAFLTLASILILFRSDAGAWLKGNVPSDSQVFE